MTKGVFVEFVLDFLAIRSCVLDFLALPCAVQRILCSPRLGFTWAWRVTVDRSTAGGIAETRPRDVVTRCDFTTTRFLLVSRPARDASARPTTFQFIHTSRQH